jgi:hypothetical protein
MQRKVRASTYICADNTCGKNNRIPAAFSRLSKTNNTQSTMWIRVKGFEALTDEELDHLMQAPALVTALIGLADGELDREERTWPERLMRERNFVDSPLLKDFYMVVAEGFWASLHGTLGELPASAAARTQHLTAALTNLNPILDKLDTALASAIYQSLLRLAVAVSEVPSNSRPAINGEHPEAAWIGLPMLSVRELS